MTRETEEIVWRWDADRYQVVAEIDLHRLVVWRKDLGRRLDWEVTIKSEGDKFETLACGCVFPPVTGTLVGLNALAKSICEDVWRRHYRSPQDGSCRAKPLSKRGDT